MATLASGHVCCFGKNDAGQLGHSPHVEPPSLVPGLVEGEWLIDYHLPPPL